MPRLRHFALFVVFVTALLPLAAAGAFVCSADANPPARVGAFEIVAATLVGPATGATRGLHERIGAAYDENASGLRSGAISSEAFPPIRVLERNGLTFTLDNRRLFVFQEAGVPIRTVPATAEESAAEAWKFTTRNEGASIRVRGGL